MKRGSLSSKRQTGKAGVCLRPAAIFKQNPAPRGRLPVSPWSLALNARFAGGWRGLRLLGGALDGSGAPVPRFCCHQPFEEQCRPHLPGVQTQVTATARELMQPGSRPPTTPRKPLRRRDTRRPGAECLPAPLPGLTWQLPGASHWGGSGKNHSGATARPPPCSSSSAVGTGLRELVEPRTLQSPAQRPLSVWMADRPVATGQLPGRLDLASDRQLP